MSLLAELKQRKLVQWGLAYAAAAFALLQVMDIIAERFDWPAAVARFLIIAAVTGFFVTLILAWYHGERGAQKVSGTELLLLALLLAIGGGLLWRFVPESAEPSAAEAPAAREAGEPSPAATVAIDRKSIAVLPFENLSEDKANEYFASGMQDMILTKLSAIGDLKVISRTSTKKYASRPDNLKVIAQELGVATILEGSVQKSGDAVLINVQLIDAETDAHLWADSYPRTLDNMFGVEGEVAQKIADALKARLTASETASVASVPTHNAAAYDAFLQGEYRLEQAQDSWVVEDFEAADEEYRRAIALDPDFALAYARLAHAQLSRHWFSQALTESEMTEVKAAIDRAVSLAPDLPEAHLALGSYYYWGFHRYDDASREFNRVLHLSPNNLAALSGLGFVARRDGRVPQAVSYLEQALQLSPRDARVNSSLGETYAMLRRYDEADRLLKRSLAIAPADANSKDVLLQTRLFGFGDVAGARAALQNPPDWRISSFLLFAGDVLSVINTRAYANFFDRRFADALQDWDAAPTDTEEERRAGQVARILIRMVAGEGPSMKAECAELEPLLEGELARHPESVGTLQQLSWIEVCLGKRGQAIATARKAVAVMPVSKDSYQGAVQLIGLAQIAAHAGDPDLALEQIRQLLVMPIGVAMSVERLRLDPIWDPLRKDARFQALLEEDQEG